MSFLVIMKAAKMAIIPSILKANKIHVDNISQLRQLTRRLMSPYTTLVNPPAIKQPRQPLMGADFKNDKARAIAKRRVNHMRPPNAVPPVVSLSTATSTSDQIHNKDPSSTAPAGTCNGNPCLDLLFSQADENWKGCRFEQLLPLAWSHNPLTTLKIIFNLQEEYKRSLPWLHQNHPKTLVSNLASIAAQPFGSLGDLVEVLDLCLEDQDAVEMYERDMDYKLLHDRVLDLFVECLKSDIEKLKKRKLKQSQYCSNITEAAYCCLSNKSSSMDFLCESIAREIFPRDSYREELEADYAKRVPERLRDEVLVPLMEAFDSSSIDDPAGEDSCCAERYLEEVKAGKSKIVANAMGPEEIVSYVNHWNYGQVAELQWKTMVDDMLKQGKMKNCLAVCDVTSMSFQELRMMDLSVALTVLMSELNIEPWKGKVINSRDSSGGNEEVHLIALRGDKLRYKYDFVKSRIMVWYTTSRREEVFDLILQEAESGNLKPEQMIKTVFYFTGFSTTFDDDYPDNSWETFYGAIGRKFKEKGYENAVPHIVYWTLRDRKYHQRKWVASTTPGVTILDGIPDNFINKVLDNGGEFGPELVMEAAISGEEYKKLVLVD